MLENTAVGSLNVVGDNIDLEYMRRKPAWNFPPWHRQVLAHQMRKEARIFGGNHEAPYNMKAVCDGRALSRGEWLGTALYGGPVFNEAYYADPKGRVIKIEHSDQFDDILFGKSKAMWYAIGDALHTPVANFDTFVQEGLGYERFSVAAGAKKATKIVINEGLGVAKEIARAVDADPTIDGYLHGHSHMGGIRKTPRGKLILNDGCSTEHVQAMVHDRNGTFALITWHKDRVDVEEENGSRYVKYFKDMGADSISREPRLIEDAHTKKADTIICSVARLAPPKSRRARCERAQPQG